MIEPALALLDFTSIAAGVEAADAMVKRAQIDVIKTGTVQPGRFLVLIGGAVGEVEESLAAGREVGSKWILDEIYLPQVHPEVVEAIAGGRIPDSQNAVGIIETSTVAAAIHAADAGLKGAEVHLVELRLADGLGGKGIVLFSGMIADVEVAVEIGVSVLSNPDFLVREVIIPQLHPAIWENVSDATRFSTRVLDRI
jgi:microcompartment protein CcmL/EutN